VDRHRRDRATILGAFQTASTRAPRTRMPLGRRVRPWHAREEWPELTPARTTQNRSQGKPVALQRMLGFILERGQLPTLRGRREGRWVSVVTRGC
jgi:hypothetical protein